MRIFFVKICLILFLVGGACFSYHKAHTISIPKKIHYVWFGSKQEPLMVKKSIESWKKAMPDYEIKRWDEANCNLEANAFIKRVYKEKRWDYASDWCRLEALYNEGGVYLDTDVVLQRHLGDLLVKNLVLTVEGKNMISGGILAATPRHPYIEKIKDFYQNYKKTEHISIPWVLQDVFEIYKNFNDDFVVYPANILMFDFGGGENYAKHLYGTGRPFFSECTATYWQFQRYFLYDFAYCIKNCQKPTMAEFIIPLKKGRFYLVKHQEKGCFYAKKPKIEGYYSFDGDEKGILFLQYDSGKEEKYRCQKNQCDENILLK